MAVCHSIIIIALISLLSSLYMKNKCNGVFRGFEKFV